MINEKRWNLFLKKVIKTPACWIWTGHILGGPCGGYGHVTIGNRQKRAHIVSYEQLKGKIPSGLVLDHLCRNRSCVNPDHLEPVTIQENIRRGISPSALHALQTHCKNGHEFTQENTYFYPRKRGAIWRTCKKCTANRNAKRKLYVGTCAVNPNRGEGVPA